MSAIDPALAERAPGLLIFPFNGNAIEALDCLGSAFRLDAFIDDTLSKQGMSSLGIPVHSRAGLEEFDGSQVLAVPGSPTSFTSRRAVIESLGIEPSRFARVIHPTARISPLATIGRNVLIMAGVVVTSNAVIGDQCVRAAEHRDPPRCGDQRVELDRLERDGRRKHEHRRELLCRQRFQHFQRPADRRRKFDRPGQHGHPELRAGQPARRQPGASAQNPVVKLQVRLAAIGMPAASFTRGSVAPPRTVTV